MAVVGSGIENLFIAVGSFVCGAGIVVVGDYVYHRWQKHAERPLVDENGKSLTPMLDEIDRQAGLTL